MNGPTSFRLEMNFVKKLENLKWQQNRGEPVFLGEDSKNGNLNNKTKKFGQASSMICKQKILLDSKTIVLFTVLLKQYRFVLVFVESKL